MNYKNPRLYETYDRDLTKKLEDRLLNTQEGPDFSPNAISILEKRYFRKDAQGNLQEDGKSLLARVAANIAYPDLHYGASEEQTFETAQTFYQMMASREFMPNSPTLMNAGGPLQQLSACFVLPIEDNMRSIFGGVYNTSQVHMSGGGTGFSFSYLRMKNDYVSSTSGRASGPVSFLKAYNEATTAVNQGGFRRGANIGILRIDHPDILEFIYAKGEEGKFPRFNFSIALTDEFMEAVKQDGYYLLRNPRRDQLHELTFKDIEDQKKCVEQGVLSSEKELSMIIAEDGKTVIAQIPLEKDYSENVTKVRQIPIGLVDENKRITYNARKVFDEITTLAHKNGEPGVFFIDTANKDNPTPHIGKIESINPCIVGSSLVATENGLIRMSELAKNYPTGGILILNDKRTLINTNLGLVTLGINLNNISGVWKTGIKETFKLITKSGFEIIATADHKILTTNGWKELKSLSMKDSILIQSDTGFFNKNKSLNIDNKYINQWTKEFGQIVGWLIGNGWLKEGKNCRVGFVFSEKDKEIMNYLKKILNLIYGKEIKEVKRKNNIFQLSYHSKEFVDLYKKLGVMAVKSQEKIVPESIFTAPKETVIGFLQGLFTADGTISTNNENNTNYIRLTSKSKKLLKGVQLLLLNCGIFSKIYNRHRNKRLTFQYKTILGELKLYQSDGILYELQISKNAIPKFLSEIGFLCNKHIEKIEYLKKINFYKTHFEDQVISIEPNGLEDVYDLSEEITHSFIANGIIIHNCGEQPLLPYEACNLGHINLRLMLTESNGQPEIDYQKLRTIVHNGVHFLDNVIDMSRFPSVIDITDFSSDKITQMVQGNRKIGLGVMGFADLLAKLRIPYDTKQAIEVAEQVMGFVQKESTEASMRLAEKRGIFPNFDGSIYDSLEQRVRNAARTSIAPTGTTGQMIAGASAGIEPYFSVIYIHTDADGRSRTICSDVLLEELKKQGIELEKVESDLKSGKSFKELTYIPDEVKRTFVTANEISPEWHVRMQATFQKHVDAAISKTINMQYEATIEDVKNAYLLAHELGCKGVTVYRDGSRQLQVLTTVDQKEAIKTLEDAIREGALRGRDVKGVHDLPARVYDLETGCGTIFVTITEDEYGPTEAFVNMNPPGGCADAQTASSGISVSLGLHANVDPMRYIKHFSSIRCPQNNELIGKISCPQAVANAIQQFLEYTGRLRIDSPKNNKKTRITGRTVNSNTKNKTAQEVDIRCPDCGTFLRSEEGCWNCVNCGFSKCL